MSYNSRVRLQLYIESGSSPTGGLGDLVFRVNEKEEARINPASTNAPTTVSLQPFYRITADSITTAEVEIKSTEISFNNMI